MIQSQKITLNKSKLTSKYREPEDQGIVEHEGTHCDRRIGILVLAQRVKWLLATKNTVPTIGGLYPATHQPKRIFVHLRYFLNVQFD